MNILKKSELVATVENAISDGAKFIGVKMSTFNAPEPEIIINPASNFEVKLNYYKQAYDDNMRLNHNRDIRILGVASGNTVAAVAKLLGN